MRIPPEKARETLTRIFDQQMILVEAAIHEIAFLILEAIVIGNQFGNATGTPVRTGLARGSWRVVLERSPAVPEGGPVDPSGASTLAQGAAVIAGAQLGVPITFVNGCEYFVYLEYGRSTGSDVSADVGAFQEARTGPWSPQAPNGVVRLVAAHFPDLVRQVVSKYRAEGLRVAA